MKSPVLKQSLLLGLWSFLCVLPLLLKTGPNVVTLTYWEGAQRFYETGNPYLPPSVGRDFFFYPPFFAAIWKFFILLGPLTGVLVWSFLNSFLFWWGISCWVLMKKKQSPWVWFFLIGTAIELDISLRYQQANALLAGLVLWGLSEYRNHRFGKAGFLLALGTHLKIFPVLLAGLLFLPFHLAFGASFAGSLLVLLMVPSLIVGIPEAFWLHWEQFQSTTGDFSKRLLFDIAGFFTRLGEPVWGQRTQWATAILGATILLIYRCKTPNRRMNWGVWYSSFMALILAVVPKTESPTFVWIAPAYLLCWDKTPRARWLFLGIVFCLTLFYCSAFPRSWVSLFTRDYNSKVLANYVIWTWATFLLIREMGVKKGNPPVN